jgi:hypothetical protein
MLTDRRGSTSDITIMQKEAETKLKYTSLCVEMQQIWNMKFVL